MLPILSFVSIDYLIEILGLPLFVEKENLRQPGTPHQGDKIPSTPFFSEKSAPAASGSASPRLMYSINSRERHL